MGEWTRERHGRLKRHVEIMRGREIVIVADAVSDMLDEIERLTQERDAVIAAGADERSALGAAVADRARMMRAGSLTEERAREVACLADILAAARGGDVPAGEPLPHCPKCGRTKSVTRWTNERTGEPFYVCATAPPGNGCGHSWLDANGGAK